MIKVAALYHFSIVSDVNSMVTCLLEAGLSRNIKGALIIATEGINGTISGTETEIDEMIRMIQNFHEFKDISEIKYSWYDHNPFWRLRVHSKQEIVTLGIEGVNPNDQKGEYIEANEWDELINDPEVILLDTRNDYEYEIGTFRNAINPNTKTFREFPEFVRKNLDPKKHKKVAMFCTGGIRCEKASSFMLQEGFEKVYHLKGGILKYLETFPRYPIPMPSIHNTEPSTSEGRTESGGSGFGSGWLGACYVFDHRISVLPGLLPGPHTLCFHCQHPLSPEDRSREGYEEGVSCHVCVEGLGEGERASLRERHKQIHKSKETGTSHLGMTQEEVVARRREKRQKAEKERAESLARIERERDRERDREREGIQTNDQQGTN